MRRSILLLSALLVLSASSAFAQSVLPSSFGGWTATTRGGFAPQPNISPDQRAAALAGHAVAAAREYGFVSGEWGTYTQGSRTLQIQLYRMKDPSGAYGEYSYLRTPDMPRAGFTDHSSMSSERALVLVGNFVLDVQGIAVPDDAKDLNALVAAVTPRAYLGPLPTLSERFPAAGLNERTDHYILGPETLNYFLPVASDDWLGFSQGAEAELASYELRGHQVTLLVADFPTPEIATSRLKAIEQRLNVNKEPGANTGNLYAKRSLTLLTIVSGAADRAEADILLEQIVPGSEVTWDAPTFQFTEPPIAAMIVGIITGTGIICVFALISGIAFGGLRIVVKRFFPDKVFDRSSRLQVLQLGLGSKPINAEDFYGIDRTPQK